MSLSSKTSNPFISRFTAGNIKWNLWDEKTLKHAIKVKKPIFLYVHNNDSRWSHAMRANLKNSEITKLLNEDFIPIIADFHDAPALAIAASSVSIMMTERTGWPLIAFLTPDLKPIFGASYMPQSSEDPRNPGLLEVLRRIKWLWLMKNNELTFAAGSYRDELTKALTPYKAKLNSGLAERAAQLLLADADTVNGGFMASPKFPHAPRILLALYLIDKAENSAELETFVKKTLDAYFTGAMFDHISGGFFDYCADSALRMPYLSKHLATNASLMEAYLTAYQRFGTPFYKDVFDSIYNSLEVYKSPDGLYRSGDDAYFSDILDDYYLVENKDILSIAEAAAQSIFEVCEITAGGNYTHPMTRTQSGKHVLYLQSLQQYASAGDAFKELAARRGKKIRPQTEKCIRIAENAYLAGILASASRTFRRPELLNEAEGIMEKIYSMNVTRGELCSTIYGSKEHGTAGVQELSCILYAMLEIYKATGETSLLETAEFWGDRLVHSFGSEGAFRSREEAQLEVLPTYDATDNVLPNANGLAACTLITLAGITGENSYKNRAVSAIEAFASCLNEYPGECASLVIATLRSHITD